MKTIVVALASVGLALAACGGGNSSTSSSATSPPATQSPSTFPLDPSTAPSETETQDPISDPEPLSVADVVYIVESFGSSIYVQFGFRSRNLNEDVAADLPRFRVTARDVDGSIIETDDVVLFGVPPGQTIAWTSQLSVSREPDSLEIVFATSDWTPWPPPGEEEASYTSTNVSGRADRDSYLVTGEVVNESREFVDQVRVAGALLDGSGAIVGYGQGFINGLPPGSPTPFSFDAWFAETPQSVEIYTETW